MLRRYTWESQKRQLQHYKPRQPEPSALCQYGYLRDEITKIFNEYLNCGILAHGAARVYCDGCKYSLLVAFSSKRRGICPSCGAKRAVKFAEHTHNEVDHEAVTQALAERVLAQIHEQDLLTDDDVVHILSQDHAGFGVWMGDPFLEKESKQFIARYIERSPLSLSLEKLSIQDDIVSYGT